MRYRWTRSLVALVVLAGCSDAMAPADFVGLYSARRINGSAVPANVAAYSGLTQALVGGTLQIKADGTWRFDEVVRYTRTDGSTFFQDPPALDVGTYVVEGTRLRFSNPQPGGGPIDATVSASGLTWSKGLMSAFAFTSLEFTR